MYYHCPPGYVSQYGGLSWNQALAQEVENLDKNLPFLHSGDIISMLNSIKARIPNLNAATSVVKDLLSTVAKLTQGEQQQTSIRQDYPQYGWKHLLLFMAIYVLYFIYSEATPESFQNWLEGKLKKDQGDNKKTD